MDSLNPMRPADFIYRAIRPVLFSMDAERAHWLTLGFASRASRSRAALAIARSVYAPPPDPRLVVTAFGLSFAHPLGLAAGLDKDGEAIDLWAALGFSFAELGTVTPGDGQPGNTAPRLERIREDRAIVNRMGFNNCGAWRLAERMRARKSSIPIGANLGRAKETSTEVADDDYVLGLEAVWREASYLVLNVSSPNTPGLRDLQTVDRLEPLLEKVQARNLELAREHARAPLPILVKIAPDLADEDVDRVADVAIRRRLDGLVATNTTLRHETLSRRPLIAGGVSGPPLAPRALETTRRLYRRVGSSIPIVGVGGICSPEDAYRRIRAGATLLQVYTAFVYEGPGLVGVIVRWLSDRLERDGVDSVSRWVGADAVL